QGGHDLLMLDERDCEVGEHRLAVARAAGETTAFETVAHGSFLLQMFRRPRPPMVFRMAVGPGDPVLGTMLYSGSVLVFVTLGEIFDVLRRPVLNLHAEVQTHGSQNFLDLVQRLAAEVRSAEHFRL